MHGPTSPIAILAILLLSIAIAITGTLIYALVIFVRHLFRIGK